MKHQSGLWKVLRLNLLSQFSVKSQIASPTSVIFVLNIPSLPCRVVSSPCCCQIWRKDYERPFNGNWSRLQFETLRTKVMNLPTLLNPEWSPRRLDFTATNFVVFGVHCATCDAKMFLMALWGLWPWKLQYAFVIFGFKHLVVLSFNPMDWKCKSNFDSHCWW